MRCTLCCLATSVTRMGAPAAPASNALAPSLLSAALPFTLAWFLLHGPREESPAALAPDADRLLIMPPVLAAPAPPLPTYGRVSTEAAARPIPIGICFIWTARAALIEPSGLFTPRIALFGSVGRNPCRCSRADFVAAAARATPTWLLLVPEAEGARNTAPMAGRTAPIPAGGGGLALTAPMPEGTARVLAAPVPARGALDLFRCVADIPTAALAVAAVCLAEVSCDWGDSLFSPARAGFKPATGSLLAAGAAESSLPVALPLATSIASSSCCS